MSDSFNVFINNMPCTIKPTMPLPNILALFGAQQPYALLVNQTFIPSSQHDTIKLKANDRVDVISAIQGG